MPSPKDENPKGSITVMSLNPRIITNLDGSLRLDLFCGDSE